MADPILVIAWLVLAHLAADFVFQTGGIALAKSGRGRQATGGLLVHALIVALVTVSVVLPKTPLATSSALMVVVPGDTVDAVPSEPAAFEIVATLVRDDDHETYCVTSRTSPPV